MAFSLPKFGANSILKGSSIPVAQPEVAQPEIPIHETSVPKHTTWLHTEAADAATRDFLRSDLKEFFHKDDNIIKLLGVPIGPAWSNTINRAHDLFAKQMARQLGELKRLENLTSGDREKAMYDPLKDILEWITVQGKRRNDTKGSSDYQGFEREWLILGNNGPKRDLDTQGNNRKPDLVLVERPIGSLAQNPRPVWRQVSAILEVKKDKSDGPLEGHLLLNESVLETIDHMRMHLLSRPFQRWVFGFLFCGTDFYLLYIDRAGGAISTTKNISADSELFIEIILHMSNMSQAQFGQDPDVRFGSSWEGRTRLELQRASNLKPTAPWDEKFPVYTFPNFPSVGNIETIGLPLFIVYGLLGRGTSIWKVKSTDNHIHIMKYSWRNVRRTSESDIYKCIQVVLGSDVPGLCEFMDGCDKVWDESFQHVDLSQISRPAINPLRSFLEVPLKAEHDRVVHQLVVNTVGEPICEFLNTRHLVDVLISALEAHELLASKGILHRDISAGNILIQKNDKHPGILADVELAKILPQHDERLTNLLPPVGDNSSRPDFTCTAHFTSSQMLWFISQDETSGFIPAVGERSQFIPAVKHDLQGFFWVVIWALLVKSQRIKVSSLMDPSPHQLTLWTKSKALRTNVFDDLFGPHNIRQIYQGRMNCVFSPFSRAKFLFPEGLVKEFDDFRHLWSSLCTLFKDFVTEPEYDGDLTYRQLIDVLDPEYFAKKQTKENPGKPAASSS